jgi:hypothetical protein
VVVDDFDIGRAFFGPGETDAPLIIDPDRVLPPMAASQRLLGGLLLVRAGR